MRALWHSPRVFEYLKGSAGALEGRIVWGMNRTPRNLARARSNIMAALGHLGMLTAQTCPRGLVHEVEHVLQVSALPT